jgi:hypothetical protein
VRNVWNLMLTSLTFGLCAGLLVAVFVGTLENFNYDLTQRCLAVGALTAVITFLIVATRSSVNRRYRY